MSKQFICETQVSHMASFKGPSGQHYASLKGYYFTVQDPTDIKFFENNDIFRAKGEPTKQKPDVSKDIELQEWLKDIKGLDKKKAEKLVKAYETKENLIEQLTQGAKPKDLTEKEKQAILTKSQGGD